MAPLFPLVPDASVASVAAPLDPAMLPPLFNINAPPVEDVLAPACRITEPPTPEPL